MTDPQQRRPLRRPRMRPLFREAERKHCPRKRSISEPRLPTNQPDRRNLQHERDNANPQSQRPFVGATDIVGALVPETPLRSGGIGFESTRTIARSACNRPPTRRSRLHRVGKLFKRNRHPNVHSRWCDGCCRKLQTRCGKVVRADGQLSRLNKSPARRNNRHDMKAFYRKPKPQRPFVGTADAEGCLHVLETISSWWCRRTSRLHRVHNPSDKNRHPNVHSRWCSGSCRKTQGRVVEQSFVRRGARSPRRTKQNTTQKKQSPRHKHSHPGNRSPNVHSLVLRIQEAVFTSWKRFFPVLQACSRRVFSPCCTNFATHDELHRKK